LVKFEDIKGDLHIHTNNSDAVNTLEEMTRAAIKLGYEYIAFADHSKAAFYANGLTEERLQQEINAITKLQAKYKNIRILRGIEVDILDSGKLDFSDKILSQLDVVVASVHQGFKKRVTERMCAAIENPNVDIIAHPTGRLISRRPGYDINLEKVLEHAKKYNKIMEINAYPDRLDLSDIWTRKAKEMGIKIAINTDAHGIADLEWMKFGVSVARRAWLEKNDVVNTMKLDILLKFLFHR
jgi:DNA polymerase (family 10)